MIYLVPEVISGLGEDTFWTWFKREFPDSQFGVPPKITKRDVILQYSTMGAPKHPENTIGLLWELYPEMKVQLKSTVWDHIIDKIFLCAKLCRYRTTASHLMVPYYSNCGDIDIIPIGVDTDLFRPLPNRESLKIKYGIPKNRKVGFWSGTLHPMKGFYNLKLWAQQHPDIYWIVVWKTQTEAGFLEGASNFVKVPQYQLVELMNCADFFLSCGLLRPFFMVEWEAMACNLPIVMFENMEKDFIPSSEPRNDVFRLKWDRTSVKEIWKMYLGNLGL